MDAVTLETARLRLRPFVLADAADVQRLAGDRAIADTTLNVPHPYADGLAEAWITGLSAPLAAGTALTFAITDRADGALLGAIGLHHIVAGHRAEIGYWIAKFAWGRGYCTEAATEVIRHAFTALGLLRVHSHHLSRNPASGRVLQKLGMHHEGRLRGHVRKWGREEDVELYGMLVDEWRDERALTSRR